MTGLRLFLLHALMLFLDLLHVAILSIEFLVTGQTSSDTFALPVLIDSTLGLMRELASEAWLIAYFLPTKGENRHDLIRRRANLSGFIHAEIFKELSKV